MNALVALPEMFVLGMGCLILLVDAWFSERCRMMSYWLTLLTLLGAACLTIQSFPTGSHSAFDGMFVSDPLSGLLKSFIYLVSFVVLVYSREYLEQRSLFRGEYFVLVLFAVLGMMIMVSGSHFISIYLGLELLSLSMYAMVAMYRESTSATEAAMKYFVLGALASGLLLYGMSMVYGATGSLNLLVINAAVVGPESDHLLLVFGLVFIVSGIAFKLGAAPFHMWAPDVYQGAPTAVTLFIGTAPKLAGFALAFRLLVDGLGGLQADWIQMLVLLSALSIAVGNVIALSQTNIKRMLAYSTVAHMGYMMLGLVAGTESGYASALFYTVIYTIMTTGAFGIVILLSRAGYEAENLEDFKGLNKRSPWFAMVMLILMFSMAGVPPFAGFWGKWFVLKEVIAMGHVWLAGMAVLFAVVGAFFYLRIIRLMYFDTTEEVLPISGAGDLKFVISLNGFAVLALGLMPGALLAICVSVLA